MCGISVIINCKKQNINKSIVKGLNDKIAHRGPDDSGIYLDKNIGMGHRRLSILDLTSAGKQPMEFKDYIIVYNGEIYNYLELKEDLREKGGYVFNTNTDTEMILAAYEFWGEECVEYFNGMWSFVIYNKKNQKLFCSRDRFGIKPFNYGIVGDYFIIASEPKQFTALREFTPVLNRKSAYLFLKYGVLNADENTFFEGIKELRGGHNLVYNLENNEFLVNKWYDIELRTKNKMQGTDLEKAGERFKELLSNSIKLRLRADVKLGACLSGGMDSSSIVSLAQNIMHPIHTVSSCYKNEKYDEQKYIDIVNSKFELIPHKVFPEMNDLFKMEILKSMIYHQDQPIPSGSHFSEYKVFETASKNGLIVMLDGQGADEYLAGYNDFFSYYWKSLLKKLKIGTLRKEITLKAERRNSNLFKELKSFIGFLFLNKLKSKIKKVLNKENSFIETDFDKEFRGIKSYTLEKTSSIQNIYSLAIHELKHSSIPYQLHSEDRNSMLHSIESRLPFLDFHLVEFCLSLKDVNKINNGKTKAVLREGMKNILPNAIVNRHDKMGFVAPDELWIRENSVEFRKELSSALTHLKGIVNDNILHQFDEMIIGNRGFENTYFRVLCLGYWKQIFNAK